MACDDTFGWFRGRSVLYGVALALAAMVLQYLAIDLPLRDDRPAVGLLAAASSLPFHIDPQVSDSVSQPPIDGRPPDNIGSAELSDLLTRARRQIEALALTSPPGDNASETLHRVLAAMPSQPDALRGLNDIAGKYALLAAQADNRGERELAKRYLDKGLGLAPYHPDLLAVQQRLAAQLAFKPGSGAPMRLGLSATQRAGTSK